MKIKIGRLKEDTMAFGNRFWIQIEDTEFIDNKDLSSLVEEQVTVIIGDKQSGIEFLAERTINFKDES